MIAKKLILSGFRNYDNQEIEFSDGVNVLYGNNAQGKTNILEAVNYFSGLKSHRGASDGEIIGFEREKASAFLEFEAFGRTQTAEIEFSRGKRKKIKINGVNKPKFSDIAGVFNTVLFCPEDLNLIKGAPGERRRFLDLCISPLKPRYLRLISDYKKILENKNNLLKSENPNGEMILLWNERLCEYGAKIILYRKSFVSALEPVLTAFNEKITGGEKLGINYKCVFSDGNEAEIKDFLLEKTTDNLFKEKAAGVSLYGPHRDDIEFFINDKDASKYASQGQQRTIALGLKLSQIEIVKKNTGEYPVLLLDDVLSELDGARRSFLLGKIDNHQVIITCTDADSAKADGLDCRFFKVSGGCVFCE